MKILPVLVVEDDLDLQEALCTTIRMAGYTVLSAADGETALAVLEKHEVGLVVSDVQMRPMDGLTLLQRAKAINPELPVLLMTAYGEVDKAVAAMRAGACDYLLKPFEPSRLLAQIKAHLLQGVDYESAGIVARDPRTCALLSLVRRVASSPATVMLTGESGSGKEVLAKFIHQQSPRAGKPFIAINCAAIPEHLLEATLFGFEKGAFTGASQSQPGKFEQAQGGTLLLDEISEMPLGLQAKLLRVLQEREVERVGGNKAIPLDIRLLATSNRNMKETVSKGTFREDLYYRLNVFPIEIPPLRERPLDIVPLAQRIIADSASSERRVPVLSASAIAALTAYSWPGNVRELGNVIQRAAILADNLIEAKHLNLSLEDSGATGASEIRQDTEMPLIPQPVTSVPDKGATRDRPHDMKSLERAHIMETLAAVNGSRKLAVQRLGISERTLRYKLQQYRLSEQADSGTKNA